MTPAGNWRRNTPKVARSHTAGCNPSPDPPDEELADQPNAAAGSSDWRFLAIAAAIVAAAVLLRLYHLGAQEVWLDEAASWNAATTPRILGSLTISNNPPLYYLLLRASVALAAQSEVGIRLLSAVAGSLFVIAMIWAGREIFDSLVGLWSGAVAALAPIHIYYCQEARAYAVPMLALILAYTFLSRALETNAWHWWALASAGAAMALYSHYFAILALLPTAYVVMVWPGSSRWRPYAIALLGSGILLVPWIIWSFLLTRHSSGGMGWVRAAREATPRLFAIPRTLEVFRLGSQVSLLPHHMKQFSDLAFPASLRLLGIAVLVLSVCGWLAPWEIGASGRRR